MAFALIDGNNFFVSCERLFQPRLNGKAVVVLSNNDGVVISRSEEAKALGIPMGEPWFRCRDFARRHHIAVFSSNYALYADLSARMMSVLGRFAPRQEVYSVDESFLDCDYLRADERLAAGRAMREQVRRWVGIPCGVGFGPSKTLAKIANHLAKKQPVFGGVCDIEAMSAEEQALWFARIAVDEVWGVGRRLNERLRARGINTVLDLQQQSPAAMQRAFSVTLARTVAELQGERCFDLETQPPPRQQILVSRSFGVPVSDRAAFTEAIVTHLSSAAEKLRGQGSVCGLVQVFGRLHPRSPVGQASLAEPLPAPTADTRRLLHAALRAIDRLWQDGVIYQKAGVQLCELLPQAAGGDLFAGAGAVHGERLCAAMDAINQRYGQRTVLLAGEGLHKGWRMRSDFTSPRWTTETSDVPHLRAL